MNTGTLLNNHPAGHGQLRRGADVTGGETSRPARDEYRIGAAKFLSPDEVEARTRSMWTEKGLPAPDELRRRRLELGFTRADVARFVESTEQTVRRWERGERVPSGRRLSRLMQLLGLGRTAPPADPKPTGSTRGGSADRCPAPGGGVL